MREAPIWLLVAEPRVPATKALTTIRLAGGGRRGFKQLGASDWKVGLERPPAMAQQLGYEDGVFGEGAIARAFELVWTGRLTQAAEIADLVWSDAPFTLYTGTDLSADANLTIVCTGRIADLASEGSKLTFSMVDPALQAARKVLQDAAFAGTGDAEGPVELTGKPKRRAWGINRNVELWPLDVANNIWVATDPARPLQSFVQIYDKGNAASALTVVAWAGSILGTLNALRAAAAPAGGAAVAPSIGCIKWWFSNPGKLTADLQGEVGAGYIDRPADIAAAILSAAGAPAIEGASLIAARAAVNKAAGRLVDNPEALASQEINDLLSGVGLHWKLSASGQILLGQWSWTHSGLPALAGVSVNRIRTHRPAKQLRFGWRTNNCPMSRGDIAAVIFDAAYADGTPVEALKPAEIGATLGAKAGTNLLDSGGATLSDSAIKNLNITMGANGAISGAGGGQVTIGGLGFSGDLTATSGDNMIRNSALATNASDWLVNAGTAVRTTSTTAGDQPAFMRASGVIGGSGINLLALNGGGTGVNAIPIRPGSRLFISWLARADILNTGAGATRRYCPVRLTYYNAAGTSLGTNDLYDQSKAAAFVEAGGCGPNWDLHRVYHDAPANAVAVKIEIFPIIGTPAAGRFIDITKPFMGQSQAGADQTYDQLLIYQVQPRATVGENLCRNGDFSNGSDGWWTKATGGYATSELAWRVGTAEGVPGWLRHTPAGNTVRATYHPTRFDRATPYNAEDGMPVIPGREVYLQFVYRSDGNILFGVDASFYTSGGTVVSANQAFAGGILNGSGSFTANTTSTVVRSGICKITVPAGANIMFIRVNMGRPGGSTATYGEMSLFTLNAAEPGATVGARAGTNLVDSAGASLSDSSIKNLNITMGANGAISGAGGGQVTPNGLGLENGADVTSFIAGPASLEIACTADGVPKADLSTEPLEAVFRLYKAGAQVTSGITWSVTTLSGTLTRAISGAGSGLLSISAFVSETVRLRIDATYGGVTRQFEVVVRKASDPPPVGGTGGVGNPGTTASTASISNTSSTTYGSANAGPLTAKAGTAGQVALTANLDFQLSGGGAIATLDAYGKWQWRVVGGSWADVDTEDASTTSASRQYNAGDAVWENSPGYLPVAMTKTGLTSGTDYEFQLLLRVSSARATSFIGLAKAEGS